MSGLPAVPAFRHDTPPLDAVSTTPSTSPSTAMAGGVMSVADPSAPVADPSAPVADPVPGPWGCNVVANCTNPAVIQWAAPAPTGADPMHAVPVFACADHEGA